MCVRLKVKSLSRVRLSSTPWTAAYLAPPFMGFSRQEYWSGLPFPSPGESSLPRDWTQVSRVADKHFTVCATRKCKAESTWNCHNTVSQVCMLSHFSRVRLSAALWTIAHEAPLSMGILQARILEWVAMPSSRGIFPTQGLNSGLIMFLALAGRIFTTSAIWEAIFQYKIKSLN